MSIYLYTMQNCDGCESARSLLHKNNVEFIEIPLDNPLVQLGSQVLFKDGLVHAPLVVDTEKGVFMLNNTKDDFLKIKGLN